VFEFHWPWLALLLPLPWLVRIGWEASARSAATKDMEGEPVLLHPAVQHLELAFAHAPPGATPSSMLHALLVGALWASLVTALMGPQWMERHEELATPGHDLMLAVDVSRSMDSLDFTVDGRPVNRLAVVKGVVGRFVEHRRGDRLGLILFGDAAFVQAPLTVDGNAVRALLDSAVPRMAGDATAIGDAIGLAVKKLRERPKGSRVLILITDGENTAGSLPPLEAARLAAQYGVRVYTIGVGSKGEVPFPKDGRITMEKMEIDEDLLRTVSQWTGGAYFRATDTQALEEIYRRIDALEKTEAATEGLMLPTPLYRWPLSVALLSLLTLALLYLRRTVSSPI
jgi:Ca-activated chloride channel family protein